MWYSRRSDPAPADADGPCPLRRPRQYRMRRRNRGCGLYCPAQSAMADCTGVGVVAVEPVDMCEGLSGLQAHNGAVPGGALVQPGKLPGGIPGAAANPNPAQAEDGQVADHGPPGALAVAAPVDGIAGPGVPDAGAEGTGSHRPSVPVHNVRDIVLAAGVRGGVGNACFHVDLAGLVVAGLALYTTRGKNRKQTFASPRRRGLHSASHLRPVDSGPPPRRMRRGVCVPEAEPPTSPPRLLQHGFGHGRAHAARIPCGTCDVMQVAVAVQAHKRSLGPRLAGQGQIVQAGGVHIVKQANLLPSRDWSRVRRRRRQCRWQAGTWSWRSPDEHARRQGMHADFPAVYHAGYWRGKAGPGTAGPWTRWPG